MKRYYFILIVLLSGCSTSLQDYAGSEPTFNLEAYFNGRSVARGILQDYKGKITRHFCVDIVGTWNNNQGTLHESFYFNDGEEQTRIWEITTHTDGTITGTAGDVVGQASGAIEGAALNWQYTLQVPVNESIMEFEVDDWIIQTDEERLMNRSYLKKWGITVAEIFIHFDKSETVQMCKPPED